MVDFDLPVVPIPEEAIHRVIVLGRGGVGKSAITIRFMYDEFEELYTPTQQDSYRKLFILDGVTHSVDILDTAGEENYAAVRDAYLRDGDGFMCVFSLTDNDSFNALDELRDQILRVKGRQKIPIVLVGNKLDLKDESKVSEAAVLGKAKKWDVSYFETSASKQVNVDEAFHALLRDIVYAKEDQRKHQTDVLAPKPMARKKDKKCCLIA